MRDHRFCRGNDSLPPSIQEHKGIVMATEIEHATTIRNQWDDVDYPADVVFTACKRAAQNIGWPIVEETHDTLILSAQLPGIGMKLDSEYSLRVQVVQHGPGHLIKFFAKQQKSMWKKDWGDIFGTGSVYIRASLDGFTDAVSQVLDRSHEISKRLDLPTTGTVSSVDKGEAFSVADELEKLSDLRARGLLTDSEFADAKANLLDH